MEVYTASLKCEIIEERIGVIGHPAGEKTDAEKTYAESPYFGLPHVPFHKRPP